MSLKVGIDFGTSNSGVAIYDGSQVRLLPIDPQNVTPQVVKTILYITKDFKHYIGQEAVELYYRHNVNRRRHFVRNSIPRRSRQASKPFRSGRTSTSFSARVPT